MNHLQKTHQPIIHRISYMDPNKSQSKITPSNQLHNENRSQMYISIPSYQQQLSVKSNSSQQHILNNRLDGNSFQDNQSKFIPINNNLYLLMKEQIDIANANYRQKINIHIKSQAQEIQKLSYIILNHTNIINKQTQIIKKLRGNDMNNTKIDNNSAEHKDYQRVSSKSPGKLSLTQKKFVNRSNVSPLKDPKSQIQSKINHLNNKLSEINSQLQEISMKSQDLLSKISNLQKQFQKNIIQRLKIIKQRIQSSCSQSQIKITSLQGLIKSNNNQRQDIQYKLSSMQQEVQFIKEQIYNISNREYVYDSYPLNVLKEQIKQIMNKVEQITKNKQPSSNVDNSHQHSSQSLTYSQRFANEKPIFSESLNRSQFSSLSHYAPKYLKAFEDERVKRSNDWQLQQDQSSFSQQDDDQFFHPVVRSQMLIDEQTKGERLQRILLRQNRKLPVRVQVDQTGYIKYYSTGMYILDQNGDGFDLSKSQIQGLKERGVIN